MKYKFWPRINTTYNGNAAPKGPVLSSFRRDITVALPFTSIMATSNHRAHNILKPFTRYTRIKDTILASGITGTESNFQLKRGLWIDTADIDNVHGFLNICANGDGEASVPLEYDIHITYYVSLANLQ